MNTAEETDEGGNVIKALKGKINFSLLWIIQTSSAAHTVSCTMCTGAYCTLIVIVVLGPLSLVAKQPGHAVEHST
jgi:hypothetical protein